MTLQPSTGARVVWTGRSPEDFSGGLDGWTVARSELETALDGAAELLILDPLSFPWRSLQGRRRLPLTVRLPGDLSADDLDDLLGRPLLQHLGAHDRLLDPRPDRRQEIAARHDLADEVWLPFGPDGGGAGRSWVEVLADHLSDGLVEVASDLGTFLVPADDAVTLGLLEHGDHRRSALNALLAVTRPGDLVVDADAGAGAVTVPVARVVGPSGTVLAVAGSTALHSLLAHNVIATGVDGWTRTGEADGESDPGRPVTPGRLRRLLGDGGQRLPDVLRLDLDAGGPEALEDLEALLAGRPVLALHLGVRRRGAPGHDGLDGLLQRLGYDVLVVRAPDRPGPHAYGLERVTGLPRRGAEPVDVLALPADSPRYLDLPLHADVTPAVVPPAVVVPLDPVSRPLPHAGARRHRWHAKHAELQLVAELVRELDDSLAEPAESVVEVHGSGAPVPAIRRASRCLVQRRGEVTDELFTASPSCTVVWLADGGQPGHERVALVRDAVAGLGPGGRLVLVGHVVSRPGGPTNPSFGQLVEEVGAASSGALHVDEVRSVRLSDEPWARAVIVGATRLGPETPR